MLSIKRQSGASLFLAVITLTVFLAIVLGLSTIFLGQTRMFTEMGYSVIAFYAADAGIERVLSQKNNPLPLNGYSATLTNGSKYRLLVFSSGESDCSAPRYCIKSIGEYQGTYRAIEVIY